ncbi:alpha-tocopherol transfer protein [Tribolium castaneum]|uniref:Alpha-tocopherol transfer protein-like n=1 Tax=Tribolium castaneum TaxID=7070 RepID=D6W9C3_TRICA|nr:PREDICTED: alpha-tocopherol transfer protein [Tribolium castaneum]EEZ98182.1 Alpha-tocopherol transfer protein-like [Tribolium castaneum]|eukprot:XP_969460.1 PREDICTED: alpha-tocopherol transfer protein [Tribolium castaneum]
MPPQEIATNQKEDIGKIREWLTKQPHLPQNIDDVLILRFLHTCNYSLEQTKQLIDLFYTIRSQAPEIFGNRDPSDAASQEIFKIIDLVPLPKPTKDNHKLFIYRLADPDPDKYNFVDSLRTFFMIADTRMVLETEFHSGEIPIFDMEGFSLRHLTKITLPVLKKYMLYTQEAHPIRLKQIHILNIPPFLDRCLALLKPFMKSEVASMLHFHLPNSETLFDYVSRDVLPAEYGGNVGKLSEMKDEWVKKVLAKKEYFADESRWRVDESKRPAQNQNGKQLFGMQGSFRSLSID